MTSTILSMQPGAVLHCLADKHWASVAVHKQMAVSSLDQTRDRRTSGPWAHILCLLGTWLPGLRSARPYSSYACKLYLSSGTHPWSLPGLQCSHTQAWPCTLLFWILTRTYSNLPVKVPKDYSFVGEATAPACIAVAQLPACSPFRATCPHCSLTKGPLSSSPQSAGTASRLQVL